VEMDKKVMGIYIVVAGIMFLFLAMLFTIISLFNLYVANDIASFFKATFLVVLFTLISPIFLTRGLKAIFLP